MCIRDRFNGEITRINFYKPTNDVREQVRRMYLGEIRSDITFIDSIDKQSAILIIDPNSCRLTSRTDSLVTSFDTLSNNSVRLSLIHICRCRRYAVCRSRWSP
eukprot:TRINITY_DN21751_c0_g1_i4.p1 TRINITY_DN21751_c0_g1~~TRINITY_DN21751_c0_g1_i4.p1  ORF type:complete len:103 (+),score=29.15 TRINITY_DN21751_c0_g1_i4:84-392(+)